MKISIGQKLLLLSFIILLGNGVVGYVVFRSDQKLHSSEQWVRHSEQVISQLANICLGGKEIETAARGFVISDDSAFLAPLNAAQKTTFKYIIQIKQLTRDNFAQQRRIDSLNFYMHRLLDFSIKMAEIRSKKGLAPAIAFSSAPEGKRYTKRILEITNAIQLQESILLKLRRKTNEQDMVDFDRFSMAMFIAMAGFTVLLLVVIGKYLLQNKEKGKRAAELIIANDELLFQNDEKEKRAAELDIANDELSVQSNEKGKRAAELIIANKELSFQSKEKGKRAAELIIANEELFFQNDEKGKRAAELVIANKELLFQNEEKEKRAAELIIANIELSFQNDEKEKRAAELTIANKELLFQNEEKEKRAEELIIANEALLFQNKEKEKRAAELTIANKELSFQNKEKEKRAAELKLAEIARIKMVNELMHRNKDLEQFAYIISHNLRAPVANIIGASSALNDIGLSTKDKKILSSGINVSIIKLDEVVNDLNHILQVKGEINETKEIVHFSELVEDIKISIKNLIDKAEIEIKYDFAEINEFLTVKPYMYSIFFNLISNSVKYRRQQTHSIVKIHSYLQKNKVKLLFTDNGMGIDLKKRGEQVFGLYKRFHPNIEGKGMGLFMVKTQIESLGGKISIKSEENKGTEFKIEFAI